MHTNDGKFPGLSVGEFIMLETVRAVAGSPTKSSHPKYAER